MCCAISRHNAPAASARSAAAGISAQETLDEVVGILDNSAVVDAIAESDLEERLDAVRTSGQASQWPRRT
jgi:hypothetical protein